MKMYIFNFVYNVWA